MSVRVPKEGGAEAFKAWKAAGIDVIELGVPRVDSDEEEVQASAWARQVKDWADAIFECGLELSGICSKVKHQRPVLKLPVGRCYLFFPVEK